MQAFGIKLADAVDADAREPREIISLQDEHEEQRGQSRREDQNEDQGEHD